MDNQTQKTLAAFKTHYRIKKLLTVLCYLMIGSGIIIYFSHALTKSKTVKIVTDFKKNPNAYKIEKTMTNPTTNFQYNENQIYHIKAKKASHSDQNQATLYDVFAKGELGNITAGKLEINKKGDHLIFTQNPVLILNAKPLK